MHANRHLWLRTIPQALQTGCRKITRSRVSRCVPRSAGVPTARAVAWIETLSGTIFWFLAALTTVDPNWLERTFGVDLDAGSGWAEWSLAFGFAAVAAACSTTAAVAWRGRIRERSSSVHI